MFQCDINDAPVIGILCRTGRKLRQKICTVYLI